MEEFICGPIKLSVNLIKFTHVIFQLVKIIVPIALIFLGMLDMGKAMVQDKGENMKKNYNLFLKRIISAIMVFFVVMITQFVFNLVSDGDDSKTFDCINCFVNGPDNDKCVGMTTSSSSSKHLVLNTKSVDLVIPKKKNYTINVSLNNKKINPSEVKWSSSNTNVATVENGVITAVGKGTTTVKLEYKEYTAKISVKVTKSTCVPDGIARFGEYKYEDMVYYMYVSPEIINCDVTDIPLVLYLHGNQSVTNEWLLKELKKNENLNYPAIIVFPKKRSGKNYWKEDDDFLISFCNSLKKQFNVNPNRISITGYSWGANGAWELGYRHDDYFSAMTPVAPSWHMGQTTVQKKIKIPIYGFCDDTDSSYIKDGPTGNGGTAEKILRYGGHAKWVYTSLTHQQIPEFAYGKNNVIEWLIKQDRSKGFDNAGF